MYRETMGKLKDVWYKSHPDWDILHAEYKAELAKQKEERKAVEQDENAQGEMRGIGTMLKRTRNITGGDR